MSIRIGLMLLIFGLVVSACSGSPQVTSRPTLANPILTLTVTHASIITPVPVTPPATYPPTMEMPTSTPDTDPAYYFGGLVVTLDNVGQTIPLKKGQNFLLSLGEHYRWEVTIQPSEILSRNMKITPGVGEQGLYIARAKGKATLRALGYPMCRLAQPPCNWPNVIFQINVLIE